MSHDDGAPGAVPAGTAPLTMTVVVPATNEPATLGACLAALEAADEAADELIVVREPRLAGPAQARNAGARTAGGDIVVFVDADVCVHPDALARLRRWFREDPAVGAVFGSYDDAPEAPQVVSQFRNLLHHHVHQRSAGEATTFWAGLGAVRRDVFLRAGGFDAERFAHPCIEDVELGARIAAQGDRILLDPAVQGTHLKSWTLRTMIRTDFTSRGVPWVRMLLQSGSSSSALNLGWRHRISALLAVAIGVSALTRSPRAGMLAVAAFVAANRDFYVLLHRRRGPGEAVVGVGLHVVHHLTGVAAVPVGVAAHVRAARADP